MTEEINSNEKKDGPITDVGKKFAGAPTTFFNYLSDELLCKLEFISVDNNRLNASQTNFYSAVERGSVSDWGVSYHRKPFNLENYPINSLLVSGLTITFILYLIYSYLFGA